MNEKVNMIYRIAEGISKMLQHEIESLEIKKSSIGVITCTYGYVTLETEPPIKMLIRDDGSFEKVER